MQDETQPGGGTPPTGQTSGAPAPANTGGTTGGTPPTNAPSADPASPAPDHETDRSEATGTADAPNPDLALGETAAPAPTANQAADREPPAAEQSTVATDRDKVITGDSGLFDQQPVPSSADPNTPVRTSSPPASLQSGVPFPVESKPEEPAQG